MRESSTERVEVRWVGHEGAAEAEGGRFPPSPRLPESKVTYLLLTSSREPVVHVPAPTDRPTDFPLSGAGDH